MKNKWKNREKMLLDYKLELCKMSGLDGLRCPAEEYLLAVRAAKEYPEAVEWVPIMKGSKEVGFIYIMKKSLLHYGEDYNITETYVKPEYRRQGLAGEAVKKFFKSHPGKYSMEIMIGNLPSAMFWDKIVGDKLIKDRMLTYGEDGLPEHLRVFFNIEENEW